MSKTIEIRNQSGSFGHVWNADITPGVSVRIFGKFGPNDSRGAYDRTFRIGDQFVSGSYNLIYLDQITGITAKNVLYTENGQNKRMKLSQFVWRNADFDLEKIREHNRIESYNI